MAKTQSTFAKRQKELARQARQKDKQARRLEAKQQKAEADVDGAADASDDDPDLVGIRLGPQPRVDEYDADGDEAAGLDGLSQ